MINSLQEVWDTLPGKGLDCFRSSANQTYWCIWCLPVFVSGARTACWLECQTCDRKVVSMNLSWSSGRFFFSRVNFVCRLLFGVHSTSMLWQWHVKDPSHSARSAGGRLHLNMHTPSTHQSQSGLIFHCSGIVWESIRKWAHMRLVREHLVSRLTLSWLSHCGLFLA